MLTLEQVLPATGWLIGTMTERKDWAEGLWTMTVQADVTPFVPGQFLQLGLPVGERWVKRAYSVASAPHEAPQFYIALVPDGELTPSLDRLRPGDPVGISKQAAGHFTLEHVPDARVLWLFATGTGLAPYIAMLRTEAPWSRFERIAVVHGVRRAADLAYKDELLALSEARGGRLSWLPLVTRDPDAPGVMHGRIPQLIPTLEEAVGEALRPETSQVLLCGNPEMIKDMETLLVERGMNRNKKTRPGHYTTERYW